MYQKNKKTDSSNMRTLNCKELERRNNDNQLSINDVDLLYTNKEYSNEEINWRGPQTLRWARNVEVRWGEKRGCKNRSIHVIRQNWQKIFGQSDRISKNWQKSDITDYLLRRWYDVYPIFVFPREYSPSSYGYLYR